MHNQGIEKYLMIFYPKEYIPKFVFSPKDIFIYRKLLSLVKFDDEALHHLTELIILDIRNKRRFKKLDCLRVIKKILKNKEEEKISGKLLESLFLLFQEFVFYTNEEVQWCVSVLLKDQILTDVQVHWLINNYRKSTHIVNRLLRYPVRSKLIERWATDIYRHKELRDRLSEVVGILINENIPTFVKERNDILLWAVYYSKNSNETKQRLLIILIENKVIDDVVDISIRLNYPNVIKKLLGGALGRSEKD